MGILFQFDRLLQKYSAKCGLLSEASSGNYVGGEWLPAPAPPLEDIIGAVLPMTDRKIYQSGGIYSEQDKEFLTTQEIPLVPVHYVVHKGMKYQVQENTDYSDFAGFYAYNLKRVDVFDRSGKN